MSIILVAYISLFSGSYLFVRKCAVPYVTYNIPCKLVVVTMIECYFSSNEQNMYLLHIDNNKTNKIKYVLLPCRYTHF